MLSNKEWDRDPSYYSKWEHDANMSISNYKFLFSAVSDWFDFDMCPYLVRQCVPDACRGRWCEQLGNRVIQLLMFFLWFLYAVKRFW